MNEDLTLEKRRIRWRIVERARKNKKEEKQVVIANRRIWIEGKE